MEPKFNPEEFKPAGDGFVKKEAVEDKEKAERMAHVENSIRLKMDEAVEIAMAEIKRETIDRVTQKAIDAGEEEGRIYDREKMIEEFKNIEGLQVVKLDSPYCCNMRGSEEGSSKKHTDSLQDYIYVLIGKGEVNSNTFVMRNCSSQYYFVKDKKVIGKTGRGVEYFDSLLKK